jgi:purine-nucleoside phosphorylase
MFNHHRGLWGYRGTALDGEPLIVQATGIGGPSLIAVVSELAALGVTSAIRIGTCSPLGTTRRGTVVIADCAAGGSSSARAISDGGIHRPDHDLLTALTRQLGNDAQSGPVASGDLAFDQPADVGEAIAHDLSTASLFALAEELDLQVAAALIVARDDAGEISDAALEELVESTGRAALAALGRPTQP